MSAVIQWAVPDNYAAIDTDIRFVIIEKQAGGMGSYVKIAEVPSTTDGLAKSATNNWIDQYEDYTGSLNDVYRVAFKDAAGRIGAYSQYGKGGFLSAFHDILDSVRVKLGDDNPAFYQLDETPQYKWSGTQLGKFLINAMRDFNGMGPTATSYNFDTIPDDAIAILEMDVIFYALSSRSIKEIPNAMKYNDGVSFDLSNRPGDYQRAAEFYRKEFKEGVDDWKFSHRPKAIGLGSQRLPFRVTRPLSMLPNMKNIFGF